MKYKRGDMIITGPYQLKAQRGSHVILAEVIDESEKGIWVEAHYLVWDDRIEAAERWELEGTTFLPNDQDDYKHTELLHRESDSVDRLVEWIQYDGQASWVAEHEPEVAI